MNQRTVTITEFYRISCIPLITRNSGVYPGDNDFHRQDIMVGETGTREITGNNAHTFEAMNPALAVRIAHYLRRSTRNYLELAFPVILSVTEPWFL
ncbi:MAG: hypothetical protein JSV13_09400 [Nitrospiraceae bacterium]|nr:MAG: hypothetical protein JSV13_09400 [Nitrospiraceae bacterium]